MSNIVGTCLAILALLCLIFWIAWWTFVIVVPFLGGDIQWETARKKAREEQRKQLDEEWRKTLRESAGIDETKPEANKKDDN
jgi:hypothetical protein